MLKIFENIKIIVATLIITVSMVSLYSGFCKDGSRPGLVEVPGWLTSFTAPLIQLTVLVLHNLFCKGSLSLNK